MQLHHVGWAVHSCQANHDHFARQLGLPYEGEEDFPLLKVAFYRAGHTLIELLEPTGEGNDVTPMLEARGEGVHHLAYLVDDVQAALDRAEAEGLRLVDTEPRPGARGTMIGFVDPQRADGMLVEFVQEPGG
jgi:methylmalonyl-CoA/ethylmalonyl-CoA epimerase